MRDAFFNVSSKVITGTSRNNITTLQLPVRRLSHPSTAKTWDLARQEIEVFALVSPSVSFSLEDLRKNEGSGNNNRMIRIPKVRTKVSK